MAGETASAAEMARIKDLSVCGEASLRTTQILSGKFRSVAPHQLRPRVQRGQRALANDPVPFLLVADFLAQLFFKRLQQVEGDVGRLKVLRVGVRDVVN